MKKKEKPLLKAVKEESNIWRFFILAGAAVFLFLRFFADGISYPGFNFFWNMYFFLLLIIQALKDRLKAAFFKEEAVIFLFFLFSVISSGISPVKSPGVVFNAQILAYICLFSLIAHNLKRPDAEILYIAMLASAFCITVYGIYQYFWGLEQTRQMIYSNPELLKTLPPTFLERMKSKRIFATFIYPNTYASFLLFIIPAAFFKAFSKEGVKERAFSVAVLILALFNLLLTGSFGGAAICLFVLLVMALYIWVKNKKKFFYMVFCLVLFLAALFFSGYHAGRLPKKASMVDRVRYWQAAVQIFYENPVLGAGRGNYKHYYTRFKHPESMEARHAHSIFFETLAEGGIAGAVLLFSFFFMLMALFFQKGRSIPLLAGTGFGFSAFLLHNMIDFNFVNPAVSVLFFAAGGLGLALRGDRTPAVLDSKLTKWLNCLIIITVFLTAVNYARYTLSRKNILQADIEKTISGKFFCIDRAKALFPLDYDIYEKQGDIYLDLSMARGNRNHYKLAMDSYLQAAALNPYSSRIYRKTAFVYEELGDAAASEKMLLKSIENYPAKKQYNLEAAVFYKRHGNDEMFERYYSKSKRLMPATIEESQINKEYIKWIESQK